MMIKPRSSHLSPYVIDLEEGEYIWCGCGLSRNQPFCDNTHKGTEFEGMDRVAWLFETEKDGTVALCGCKETNNPPYCDGTHKTLRERI